jgi:Bacterial TSP3 repeat
MSRLVALVLTLALVPAATAAAAPAHSRLPKAWAKKHRLGVKAGARDTDRDGLTNWGEYRAKTNPRRTDTDRDHVSDAAEDRDRDRLTNGDELIAGTDPRRRDSDRDHVSDGREDADRDGLPNADEAPTGHALRNPDTDGDGIPDGRENAGRIAAVSGYTITIKLAAGGALTARLDGDSWVTCDSSRPRTRPTTSGTPATGSSGSGSSGSQTPTPDAPAEDAPDSGDDPSDALDPEDDDPASFAVASDDPDDDDEDPVSDDPGTPDLGDCSAAVRVGAFVEEATVAGDALTDLALMRR